MNEEAVYYELNDTIQGPGLPRHYKGERLTKEEWMALGLGFLEDDFGDYGRWFRKRTERMIDIDLCVSVVTNALGLPSGCSPNALQETELRLRRMEKEATDIAKAYGLRCAADTLAAFAEKAAYPTPDDIRAEVRRLWEKKN